MSKTTFEVVVTLIGSVDYHCGKSIIARIVSEEIARCSGVKLKSCDVTMIAQSLEAQRDGDGNGQLAELLLMR